MALGVLSAELQESAQLPFGTALVGLVDSTNTSQLFCKGVAVTSDTLLTAAHCLLERKPDEVVIVSPLGFKGAARFTIHPLFSESNRLNQFDVALVQAKGKLTETPWPIVNHRAIDSGDTFVTFTDASIDADPHPYAFWARVMQVADTEAMIKGYLQMREGDLPYPDLARQLQDLLLQRDQRIRLKIRREFGGMIFSLYEKNRTSICRGDSGSPAIISRAGKVAIVGIATAIGKLEWEKNPDCKSGSTSIFTRIDRPEVLEFIDRAAPRIGYF